MLIIIVLRLIPDCRKDLPKLIQMFGTPWLVQLKNSIAWQWEGNLRSNAEEGALSCFLSLALSTLQIKSPTPAKKNTLPHQYYPCLNVLWFPSPLNMEFTSLCLQTQFTLILIILFLLCLKYRVTKPLAVHNATGKGSRAYSLTRSRMPVCGPRRLGFIKTKLRNCK